MRGVGYSMATITISVMSAIGQQRIARLIAAVGPRPILKVAGMRVMSYVDESFRTRGRGQWQPLAQSTLDFRRHGGDVPLQDTGKYKQSFVIETDERTFVEVGTNLKTESGIPLAAIHENGTGPYTIHVRRAKVLAAQNRAGVWVRWGKKVDHPGISARPVLPNQAQAETLVRETVEEMIQMEADRGSGQLP